MWNGNANLIGVLVGSGANINEMDNNGTTPLVLAVMLRFPECAKELLMAGAAPNVFDSARKSLLHWSAEIGHEEILNELVLAGADLNVLDAENLTALHNAARRGHIGCMWILMNYGIHIDRADLVIGERTGWPPDALAALRHGLKLRNKCTIS